MNYRLLPEEEKKANWEKILHLFEIADKDFIPPLSQRGNQFKEKIKNSKKAKIIVAENGPSIGGIAIFWEYSQKMKSPSIEWLIVEPSERNQGIGKTLAKKAVEELEKIGAKKIKITTYDSKKAAVKICESLGFKTYRTKKKTQKISKIYLKREQKPNDRAFNRMKAVF